MVTKEKASEVKKMLRSGVPEGEIKNELRNQGFTEQEISELFRPKPSDMRSWYLLFGLLFTVIGLYFFLADIVWWPVTPGVVLLLLYWKEEQQRKRVGGE